MQHRRQAFSALALLVGLTAPALDGVTLANRPGAAREAGLAYIPERPLDNAVAADLDVALNVSLRTLRDEPMVRGRARRDKYVVDLLRDYDVRPPDPTLAARDLSGGNLQKLVIARELSDSASAVLACYPTMGLDARATVAVRQSITDQARDGAAVLWISEDLDELLAYAHRIAVLHDGRLAGVLPTRDADRDTLGRMMTGVKALSDVA